MLIQKWRGKLVSIGNAGSGDADGKANAILAECHADAALADIKPDAGQYFDGFPESPAHLFLLDYWERRDACPRSCAASFSKNVCRLASAVSEIISA